MRRPYALVVYTVFTHYHLRLLRPIVREAAFLVADTAQVHDYLLATYALPEKCVVLIRNGVCLGELQFSPTRDIDGNIILAAASLYPKKGLHVLLNACALLKKRGIPFRCVLVGDGHERGRLESLKSELGVAELVDIVGYVSMSELKEWYYKSSVFVMPSVISDHGETDGLPTVLIEACATGLPVIGSRIAGIPEIIRDGRNGFLVAPNDASSLADRLQFLLEHKEVREQMGIVGRSVVEQEFDLRRNVSRMCELILRTSTSSTVTQFPNRKGVMKPDTWH
jgi:glycosyltransferase involved in cell wall biosynthesis